MQSATITKYFFRIRTRNGVLVEHLSVCARDEADARHKVAQIYNNCEVLDCRVQQVALNGRPASLNYEDVVDLISSI